MTHEPIERRKFYSLEYSFVPQNTSEFAECLKLAILNIVDALHNKFHTGVVKFVWSFLAEFMTEGASKIREFASVFLGVK